MVYQILKAILRLCLWAFYKELKVNGREKIPAKGPMILAVNHPNSFMDPLIVARYTKQRVGFLANSKIFKSPLAAKVFAYLHVIPIFRKQDLKPGEVANNASSFRKCFEYLDKSGTIMIFPEGNSFNELKLRELKTGTARIALEWEAQRDFTGGMKIATIALNYYDPIRFNSKVVVNIDEPILVADYKELFAQDAFEAARQLTDDIAIRLGRQMVLTENQEQEAVMWRVKRIYGEHLMQQEGIANTAEGNFFVLKELGAAVKYFSEHDANRYELVKDLSNQYFETIEQNKLREGFFSNRFGAWNKFVLVLLNLIYIPLGLPVFLLGLILNYIPYVLPEKIAAKVTDEIEYRAGIMMVAGLITFGVFYTLELLLFHFWASPSSLQFIEFALFLPFSGYLVLHYYTNLQRVVSVLRYLQLKRTNTSEIAMLKTLKTNIIDLCEEARVVYYAK